MTGRSLQVTYRKGRAPAAYLHLSHPTGEKSAKTVASPDGLSSSITPRLVALSESRSQRPRLSLLSG
jgi:hypothetical protein